MSKIFDIPFNKPTPTGKELFYISQALNNNALAGDGVFTKKCEKIIQEKANVKKTLLTHSCTAALEMAAILADIKPGDEIIMPSYTFVSTANAFVLRGGIPVFVDIRHDTLNIDEKLIEAAITEKTKAIVPVHYAGIGCEMDTIMQIATNYNLMVIEDAAQGIYAKYKGRHLGSIGHFAAYSFHETKNIISGEGGALLINDDKFMERAEIIREKGTNRKKFFQGLVDKYTWVDIGSSFLPSEIIAAFLFAQLEQGEEITEKRISIWNRYHENFKQLEDSGLLRRPVIPHDCSHNAHMYYILLNDNATRNEMLKFLKENQIYAVFHYLPLHDAEGGKKFGRSSGTLGNTMDYSSRLLRLPLYNCLAINDQDRIISEIIKFFKKQ